MSSSERHSENHSVEIHEEAEEGEPWLVSYADLMTLLFGFFVLMYTFAAAKLDDDAENWVKVRKELAAFFGGDKSQDKNENQIGDSKELFSPNVGIDVGTQGGSNKDTKGIFEGAKSDVQLEQGKDSDRFLGGTYVSPGTHLSQSDVRSILDLRKVVDSEKALELIIASSNLFEGQTTRISASGQQVMTAMCEKMQKVKFPFFLGITAFSQKRPIISINGTQSKSGVEAPLNLTTERSQAVRENLSACTGLFDKGANLSAMGVGYVPRSANLKGVLEDGVIIRISLLPE